MATINLGRLKPINRGDWSSTTRYTELDIVTHHENGTYMCRKRSYSDVPEPYIDDSSIDDSYHWGFLAYSSISSSTPKLDVTSVHVDIDGELIVTTAD